MILSTPAKESGARKELGGGGLLIVLMRMRKFKI